MIFRYINFIIIMYDVIVNVPFSVASYARFNWLEHERFLAHRIARPESTDCQLFSIAQAQ